MTYFLKTHFNCSCAAELIGPECLHVSVYAARNQNMTVTDHGRLDEVEAAQKPNVEFDTGFFSVSTCCLRSLCQVLVQIRRWKDVGSGVSVSFLSAFCMSLQKTSHRSQFGVHHSAKNTQRIQE